MNKAELEQLYRTLLAEYHALTEDASAKRVTGELLSSIRYILHRKKCGYRIGPLVKIRASNQRMVGRSPERESFWSMGVQRER